MVRKNPAQVHVCMNAPIRSIHKHSLSLSLSLSLLPAGGVDGKSDGTTSLSRKSPPWYGVPCGPSISAWMSPTLDSLNVTRMPSTGFDSTFLSSLTRRVTVVGERFSLVFCEPSESRRVTKVLFYFFPPPQEEINTHKSNHSILLSFLNRVLPWFVVLFFTFHEGRASPQVHGSLYIYTKPSP